MAEPRNPSVKAMHLAKIAEMYLKGRLQSEIAAQLGINQATVSRDLKKLREGWQYAAKEDTDRYISLQLAKIDELERQAWEAWESSRQEKTTKTLDRETLTISGEADEDGNVPQFKVPGKEKMSARTERLIGDPRFLQMVDRCIERRCKILGLEAPEKREVDHKGLQVVRFPLKAESRESWIGTFGDAE